MKISYSWLQTYFESPLPAPAEIERVLGEQAFEPEETELHGNETVFDFDVLPNRAPDCLCHRGVAREVAVLFGLPMNIERYTWPEYELVEHTVRPVVEVEDQEKCLRYMARRIDGVKVGPSPDWLRARLEAIGQRSINNIVDATNYVMFDLGQPLHAFDADLVDGAITVRTAQEGEVFTTLDRQEVTLTATDLVIADDEGILALAGVKGGTKAEVTRETTSIILEAASFHPITTRKTSRRIGILTDSSKRFENAPAPQLVAEAMEAVTQLIAEVAHSDTTSFGPVTDVYRGDPVRGVVVLELNRIAELLGAPYAKEDVVLILEQLGCKVTDDNSSGAIGVTPPYWRKDLNIPEDLIEEIGRIKGYSHIPAVVPDTTEPLVHQRFWAEQLVRKWLSEQGFSEIYTYTFVDSGVIAMQNVIASDKGYLRTSLLDESMNALERNARNAPLFGVGPVQLFEIGTVFPEHSPEKERWHLALLMDPLTKKARNQGTNNQLRALLETLGEHIGVDAILDHIVKETDLGIEIDFSRVVEDVATRGDYASIWSGQLDAFAETKYQPFSIYPFVTRDIALWVPAGVEVDAVQVVIREAVNDWCERIDLFDEFEKEGQVSYAFRLVFQAEDRTLSDDAVNAVMDQVNQAVTHQGWQVR